MSATTVPAPTTMSQRLPAHVALPDLLEQITRNICTADHHTPARIGALLDLFDQVWIPTRDLALVLERFRCMARSVGHYANELEGSCTLRHAEFREVEERLQQSLEKLKAELEQTQK